MESISNDEIKKIAEEEGANKENFFSYFLILRELYQFYHITGYEANMSLTSIISMNSINDEDTFIKAYSKFLNNLKEEDEVRVYFASEKDFEILNKALPNVKNTNKLIFCFKYDKSIEKTVPQLIIKYKDLFKNILKLCPEFWETDFNLEIIKNKIDFPHIYHIDLDKMDLNTLLEYSKQFPNRIIGMEA